MPRDRTQRYRRDQPPRRWWQILLRWGLVAVLLGGLAYATIPFWAPKEYLRGRLERQMARQLGLGVRIASLDFSWSRGVEIRKLTLACPEGFSRQPMISVDHIQADFDPLSFLLRSRLEWMEINHLKIAAELDASGRLNLSAIRHLGSGFQTRRISVHQASASLRLADHDRPLRLAISNLEYQSGARPGRARLTLSGQLIQQKDVSPISLRVATGTPQPIVATASLGFTNLDLSQLPLLELLPLPLSRLSGRCRGHLDLQMDSQGLVSGFGGDLTVADLDAQPSGGPEIPVIAEAGIQFSGLLDPITQRVEIERFKARLPGLDLTGRIKMSTDLLRGRWQGLESLAFSGQVHPAELAALLTGRPQLVGGLTLRGPVGMNLSARQDGHLLEVDFSADAGQVAAYRLSRQLKPAGRAAELALKARLDRRAWQVQVEGISLVLGENRFTGGGRIENLKKLIERRSQWNLGGPVPLLRDIADLTWFGACEIRELDSLGQLLFGPAGHRLELQGPINGQWVIRTEDVPRCHVRLAIPPETALTVSRFFQKPAGRGVSLEMGWAIDPDRGEVRNFNADLTIGSGRLSLEDGQAVFSGDPRRPAQAAPMRVSGLFSLENVEELLASGPFLKPLETSLAGASSGRFAAELDQGVWTSGQFDADLTGLAVQLGRAFVKLPGQEAGLSLRLDGPAAGSEQPGLRQISFRGHAPAVTCRGRVTFQGRSDRAAADAQAEIRLDVTDLRRFTSASPGLADLLAEGELSGPVRLDASLGWDGQALEAGVGLDAKQAQWISRRAAGRRKAAGVECSLGLVTRLARQGDNGLNVEVRSGRFNLARSTARCSGRVRLQGPVRIPTLQALPVLENLDTQLRADIVLDGGLKELLPELARLSEKCDLAGTTKLRASIRGTDRSLAIQAELDAEDLSVRYHHQVPPTTVPAGGSLSRPGSRQTCEPKAYSGPTSDTWPSTPSMDVSAGWSSAARRLSSFLSAPTAGDNPPRSRTVSCRPWPNTASAGSWPRP